MAHIYLSLVNNSFISYGKHWRSFVASHRKYDQFCVCWTSEVFSEIGVYSAPSKRNAHRWSYPSLQYYQHWKSWKAAGPVEILNWLLKEYADILAYPVSSIINCSFAENRLPLASKMAYDQYPKLSISWTSLSIFAPYPWLNDQLRHDTIYRKSSELNSISPMTINFHHPQFLICFELFC